MSDWTPKDSEIWAKGIVERLRPQKEKYGRLFGTDALEYDLADEILQLCGYIEAQVKENERVTAIAHRLEAHPDYEYCETNGARKLFDEYPPEGEGWKKNVHRGRDGWERFDYHEEAYWMRKTQGLESR